jgi:hypothetical protein
MPPNVANSNASSNIGNTIEVLLRFFLPRAYLSTTTPVNKMTVQYINVLHAY